MMQCFTLICLHKAKPPARTGRKAKGLPRGRQPAARPHYEFSLMSLQESAMVKSVVAKIARMFLYVAVFVLSLIVGTVISAVLMKAVEL